MKTLYRSFAVTCTLFGFILLSSLYANAATDKETEASDRKIDVGGYWSPRLSSYDDKIAKERFAIETKNEHAQVVSLVAEQIVAVSTIQAKKEIAQAEKQKEAERLAIEKEKRKIAREKAEKIERARLAKEEEAKRLEEKEREEQEKARHVMEKRNSLAMTKKVAAEPLNASTQAQARKLDVSSGTGPYTTANATHYTADCRGCSGITRTGIDVRGSIYHQGKRIVAVDPRMIPLGSTVEVVTPYETFLAIAADTGGDIKGGRIDILVATTAEAYKLGRYNVKYRIVK